MKILEKRKFKVIIFLMCAFLFSLVTVNVLKYGNIEIDAGGYSFIAKYLIKDRITPFMKIITNLGSAWWLIGLAIILLIFSKSKIVGLFMCSNLILSTMLNQILKFVIKRPRPVGYRIIEETGYSFPSGHAMVSMAFYGLLIYLVYKNIKNKYLKWGLIVLLGIIIFMIGFSRIYLGVHYISDVGAGFLFSLAYLIIYIDIMKLLVIKKGDKL